MSTSATVPGKCAVCQREATKRCGRCKSVHYCSVEHQRYHWKSHRSACNDQYQADQHTLHKKEFDRIIQTYKLNTPEKSEEIAVYLTNSSDTNKVTAPEFAEKFGMKTEEAVVFLEWVNIGVKFKEQSIDVAKKSGFR